MNIVNKLTLRQLKENKRRTLVTIIGVIISVAMITAVATLGYSFMDLLQRETIADEGEWHVLYNNVTKSQLEAIQQDEATKNVALFRDLGFAYLEDGQNHSKPYLFVKEYDEQGFQQFPIELTKGRLPQATNEVVISEHIATNGKVQYQLGDLLTLDIGERVVNYGENGIQVHHSQNISLQMVDGESLETLQNTITKSYTVVGFIKRPTWEAAWAPGYTVLSFVDRNGIGVNDTVNASVVLKKVKRSLFEHAEQLGQENNIESVSFNHNLLRFYGILKNDGFNTTLISLAAIIMAVIIVGSVSLIYNAFAISVSERSRHLGMLASVGATKRQKRNSVFFEGAVIGLISIPIGFFSGLIGIGVTFYFINSILQSATDVTEDLVVIVTPMSILIACAVSILTIFISTYIPARRASKVAAIDAIRQTMDIKLTGKKVKTSKVVRKLFGMEAEIGLKNLKRNKRRYQATVFSLVISILLFLTVSFFTDNLRRSLNLTQNGVNYDISISLADQASENDEQLLKIFAELPDVTESNVITTKRFETWVEEASIGDELRNLVKSNPGILVDGKALYNIEVHAIDDEYLQTYAKAVGADYEKLHDPRQLSAIVVDATRYKDAQAGKYVETKAIYAKAGQSLDLYHRNWQTEEKTFINKVEVAALTDQLPMGIYPMGWGGLNIIISDKAIDQLKNENVDENDIKSKYVYLKSSDPLKTQQEIEETKTNNMYVHNAYKNRQSDEQMMLVLSIFAYGFITLITLISIANIFNTITTSISLRKREFAMLKSVGMTPKGFNKMINYESIFYGIKSLFYGLPISITVMYLIYKSLMNSFSYGFTLPWTSIIIVIITVFVIVGSSMLYSSAKVKKENIIDALKQENI